MITKKETKRATRLFNMAADFWVMGNNSGNNKAMSDAEKRVDECHEQAEAILRPHGISCDYPGLYPCFTYKGREYLTLADVIRFGEEES